MHCYFQVLHVEQPEGARPPAQGPEGSHTHQGVPPTWELPRAGSVWRWGVCIEVEGGQ